MTSVVLSWPIWAAERPPIWVEVRAPILSIVVAVRPPTWVEVKSPVSTSSSSALKRRGVEAIDLGGGQRGERIRRQAAERGRVQAVELSGGQRVDLGRGEAVDSRSRSRC